MRWLARFAVGCLCGHIFAISPLSWAQSKVQPAQSTPTRVSYVARVTALEAIVAVGLQMKVPIGIVPGRDTRSLCQSQYPFDLRDMDAPTALLDIARRAQYTLTQEDGVFILNAPDTTPRQAQVLGHRFKEFKPGTEQTMHLLSAQLASWLWVDVAQGQGYGWSILDNPDAPTISLPEVMKDITAKEIADRIVTTGKQGIWISQISPDRATEVDDFYIEFESYGDADQLKREISCKW